jgi:hypothetical protein
VDVVVALLEALVPCGPLQSDVVALFKQYRLYRLLGEIRTGLFIPGFGSYITNSRERASVVAVVVVASLR